jgi:Ribonuclease G/E
MFTILAAHHPGETQIALLRNGTLDEFYLHRPAAPDGVGALHVARVIATVPAMAGAFVALHDAEAFLPDTEGAKGLTAGAYLTVQVTRAAQGGKGPRVTARLAEATPPPEGPPRLLRPGPTPLDELRQTFPAARITEAPFPEHIATETEALANRAFDLPGGLRATVAATAALTAIDLDSGAATASRAPKATAQFAANRNALPELTRQIRLRNLSSAILIDFAGMPAKRRAALAAPLQDALAQDRLTPRLAGFSNLGFAEILRPRRRPPLHELLRGPHAAGLAALRRAAAEAAENPFKRLALRAAPPVIAALQADPAALAALAHVSTHPLLLRSDPTLPATVWTIESTIA